MLIQLAFSQGAGSVGKRNTTYHQIHFQCMNLKMINTAMIKVNQKTKAHKIMVPSTAETRLINFASMFTESSFVAKESFNSLRQSVISFLVSSPFAITCLSISAWI